MTNKIIYGFMRYEKTIIFDDNALLELPFTNFIWGEGGKTYAYNWINNSNVEIKEIEVEGKLKDYIYIDSKHYKQKKNKIGEIKEIILEFEINTLPFCGNNVLDENFKLINLDNGEELDLYCFEVLMEFFENLSKKFLEGKYIIKT